MRRTAPALLSALLPLLAATIVPATTIAEADPAPPSSRPAITRMLTLEQFEAFVAARGLVLDTRSDVVYQRGHVPSALSLPYARFAPGYEKLKPLLEADKTRTIALYCGGANCSTAESVRERLVELGYTQISVFPGGWAAWREAGLPEEKTEAGVDAPLPAIPTAKK